MVLSQEELYKCIELFNKYSHSAVSSPPLPWSDEDEQQVCDDVYAAYAIFTEEYAKKKTLESNADHSVDYSNFVKVIWKVFRDSLPAPTMGEDTQVPTIPPGPGPGPDPDPYDGYGYLYNWFVTTRNTGSNGALYNWFAISNSIFVAIPTGLTATTVSDIRIDLAWTNTDTYDSVRVERSTNGTDFTEIDSIDGAEVSYQDTTGVANTNYWYRVRGEISGWYSAYSNTADDWTAWKLVYTSQGDGTATSHIFRMYCTGTDITVTLDGNGKFYTNNAGTLGESSSITIVAGNELNTYFKVTSGTSNMLWFHKNNLTRIGYHIYPPNGGGHLGLYQQSSNGPSTIFTFADVPRSLTELSYQQTYSGSIGGALSDLPSGIIGLYANAIGTITGNVSSLPDAMENITVTTTNTITGDIADLPSSMYNIYMAGSNTLSGNISGFSETMEYVYITGLNTITGDVSGISSSIFNLQITGNNTISGDLAGFPTGTLTIIAITGNNTISGDIADFPTMPITQFTLLGNNTITGNIVNLPSTLTSLSVSGYNTLYGYLADLPSGLTFLSIGGNNIVNGDIADLPIGITNCNINGLNTINGDIANIPMACTVFYSTQGYNTLYGNIDDLHAGFTHFIVRGYNTISGDIAGVPSSFNYIDVAGFNTIGGDLGASTAIFIAFSITGNNVISGYTSGKTWYNNVSSFYFLPVAGGGLDATEVDNLIIDLDTSITVVRTTSFTIAGTCAARTAASDAAVASLLTKGRTILTN